MEEYKHASDTLKVRATEEVGIKMQANVEEVVHDKDGRVIPPDDFQWPQRHYQSTSLNEDGTYSLVSNTQKVPDKDFPDA